MTLPSNNQVVKIIIADDHIVLRQALCEMLRATGGYNVLGQASDGEELIELLSSLTPDIIIMDVAMPKLDGLKALEMLSTKSPAPPVLVLSADDGEKNVRAALKSGAKGFIPKHAGLSELEFAIDSILNGKTYLSPSITNSLMSGSGAHALTDPLDALTKREIEILKNLAEGKPNRAIAKILHISTRTVDTHRSNILRKLEIKTNAELVRFAIANGLVSV